MKITARGTTGYLIYCGDHRYRFRVYTVGGESTDYDILHSDLAVTITDEDAVFYSDDTGNRLDHRPETFGDLG